MEGAPCAKSTNRRMAVFIFPCTGGEGAATLGFLSHPLHLTQGRGQAQTHAEPHTYVEGAGNWNHESFGPCLSPPRTPCPRCRWSQRCGTPGVPGALPPGCAVTNALSQHLPPKAAALVSHCPRLLSLSCPAMPPKGTGERSWTATNQQLQKGSIFLY